MAVTVPTRFPERVYWALDHHYNDTPGGHIRIYRQRDLEEKLARAGLLAPGIAPRARAALALLVDPLRGRRRPTPTASSPASTTTCSSWQLTQEPAVARVARPRAQPRDRQEPRRLHAEGDPLMRSSPSRGRRHPHRRRRSRRRSTRSRRCSSPTATSRGPRVATPTRGTWSRPRWRSTSAVGTTTPARAYEWLRSMQLARRRLARLLRRQRGRGPDARHERRLLHRDRRVAPLPHHRRHRVPRGRSGRSSSARSTTRSRSRPRPARSRGAPTTRPTARCSRARRASTSASGARSRSRSGSATSAPTGSCRSVRSPSPSRTGPTRSSTRRAGRWTGTTRSSVACCAGERRAAADRRVLGHVRRRGPRRALRLGPAVDHRGRDVRARDGARRDRRRAGALGCSSGCSSCATTTAATGAG